MKEISIVSDITPLREVFDELTLLVSSGHVPREVIERFLSSVSYGGLVSFADNTTMRAGELVVFIKPSDRLLNFLAAVRTGNGNYALWVYAACNILLLFLSITIISLIGTFIYTIFT